MRNTIKKTLLVAIVLFTFLPLFSVRADGEEIEDPSAGAFQGYVRGQVIVVENESRDSALGQGIINQDLKVRIMSGEQKDKEVTVKFREFFGNEDRSLSRGDGIVLAQIKNGNETIYEVVDRYRLPTLYVVMGILVLVAILVLRGKGFTTLVSVAASIFLVLKLLVPAILHGANPALVTFGVASAICIIIFYVGHGISKRTSLAFLSTILAIGLGLGLAVAFSGAARLFGLATEETQFVQSFSNSTINLRGLLLAGIVLGMLGIFENITISQAITTERLRNENPLFAFKELFMRSLKEGKEHAISLVNTLFLVYAAVGLPLFLLFSVNTSQPAWVLFNSEYVAEELMRALVGSITLILIVPITTAISAYYYSRQKIDSEEIVVSETITKILIEKDSE